MIPEANLKCSVELGLKYSVGTTTLSFLFPVTIFSRNHDPLFPVSRNYDPFLFCSQLLPSSLGDVLQKYSLGTA